MTENGRCYNVKTGELFDVNADIILSINNKIDNTLSLIILQKSLNIKSNNQRIR